MWKVNYNKPKKIYFMKSTRLNITCVNSTWAISRIAPINILADVLKTFWNNSSYPNDLTGNNDAEPRTSLQIQNWFIKILISFEVPGRPGTMVVGLLVSRYFETLKTFQTLAITPTLNVVNHCPRNQNVKMFNSLPKKAT